MSLKTRLKRIEDKQYPEAEQIAIFIKIVGPEGDVSVDCWAYDVPDGEREFVCRLDGETDEVFAKRAEVLAFAAKPDAPAVTLMSCER